MVKAQVLHEEIIGPVSEDNPRNSEASAIELKDGRILLAWSDFYGGYSDFAQGRISARISADGGRIWGEKFTLEENVSQMNVTQPAFLRLPSGAIAHFYARQEAKDDIKEYVRQSFDEGQTWTAEVLITPDRVRQFVINDRAVQMASGRIVLPVSWSETWDSRTSSFRSLCWYSDDEGETWHRGKEELALPRRGAMEPVFVERRDGSLMMLIRTQLGDQYRALSYDGGDTWATPKPMGLISGEAPCNARRIPRTGDLLILWNRCFTPYRYMLGRSPLNSAISRDDGETWENVREVEWDPDCFFSYPSILFRGDEVFLTYYASKPEARRESVVGRELKVKILPLAWFYESP